LKNKLLKKLNFQVLLKYPEKFDVYNEYSDPIPCSGFCIDCEKKGIIGFNNTKLTFMSHGCTTEDYISILGEMPNQNEYNGNVLFILEQPGGDYKLGDWIEFQSYTKYPPVYHYYWTPSYGKWVMSIPELLEVKNFYGNYFSYLINKYSFRNCYITNAIKCKIVGSDRYSDIYTSVSANCRINYLQQEYSYFKPSLIFCFGAASFRLTQGLNGLEGVQICNLYHPHAIQVAHRYGYSREYMFNLNEQEINEKLQ